LTSREARLWFKMVTPVVVGLIYAGTGDWSNERWIAALSLMSLGPAMQLEYNRGYWTLNPKLRQGEDAERAWAPAPQMPEQVAAGLRGLKADIANLTTLLSDMSSFSPADQQPDQQP
jgi:hypothetical protein